MKPLIPCQTRREPRLRAAWGTLLLIIGIGMLTNTILMQPASAASTQLSLTWEEITLSDLEGFMIERRLETAGVETYIQIGTVGADIRTYTDSDPALLADTVYCYRLRAYTLAGASDYSTEACGARYTLTTNKGGTGLGRVTSRPAGIDCGSTCISNPYISTTQVMLWASASAGSSFTGWSGDCAGTASCSRTMAHTLNVTANFALDSTAHTLTVTIGGSSGGSVESNPIGIICPSVCSASFTYGGPVAIAATADPGGTFRTWRGACTTSPCSPYMNGDKAVTAVFSKSYTDGTLTPQATPIKAVHITDLRAAINTLRSRVSLGPYTYATDPTITPGTTTVKAAHLNQMCTALKQAYPAAACTTTLTSAQAIQAIHFKNLRDAVHAMECGPTGC